MLVALYVIIGYVPSYFVYILGHFQLIVKIVSHPSSIQRRALWRRLPSNAALLDIFPLFLLLEHYICLIALSRAIVFSCFLFLFCNHTISQFLLCCVFRLHTLSRMYHSISLESFTGSIVAMRND